MNRYRRTIRTLVWTVGRLIGFPLRRQKQFGKGGVEILVPKKKKKKKKPEKPFSFLGCFPAESLKVCHHLWTKDMPSLQSQNPKHWQQPGYLHAQPGGGEFTILRHNSCRQLGISSSRQNTRSKESTCLYLFKGQFSLVLHHMLHCGLFSLPALLESLLNPSLLPPVQSKLWLALFLTPFHTNLNTTWCHLMG